MARTTFYTTNPATGEVAKRTSENRTYTHAVWARPTEAKEKADLRAAIESHKKRAQEYRDTAAAGGVTRTIGGKPYTQTPEDFKKWADGSERNAAEAQRKLDNWVQAGWHVDGWCGRADLASKKASALRGQGYEALVTEATTTKPADEDPAACGVCVHGKQQHEACADCEEVK